MSKVVTRGEIISRENGRLAVGIIGNRISCSKGNLIGVFLGKGEIGPNELAAFVSGRDVEFALPEEAEVNSRGVRKIVLAFWSQDAEPDRVLRELREYRGSQGFLN